MQRPQPSDDLQSAGHVERGYLGQLDPGTGQFKEWKSPGGEKSAPYGIAYAPDGRIWYDESGNNQMVGFDPKTERDSTAPAETHHALGLSASPSVGAARCIDPPGRDLCGNALRRS
jgi:streptogramin lyase